MDKIDTIYLDSDDTLVSWRTYVGTRLHLVDERFACPDPLSNITILNGIEKEERIEILNKYYAMFPDTFRDLDIMYDFYYLMRGIKTYIDKGYKVKILTALGEAGDLSKFRLDKEYNLRKHLKALNLDLEIEFVVKSSDKVNYAKSNIILIDDYSRNCMQFFEAGGAAICHEDAQFTLARLSEILH